MARIATFKLELPCDDAVKFEAVKDIVRDALRKIGDRVIAADPIEGQPALDGEATAFFGAASVKTFVTREPKQKTPRTKP